MAVALAGRVIIHLIAPEDVFPIAVLIALGSLAANRRPLLSLPARARLTHWAMSCSRYRRLR
jgi:hypothetical protein